MLVHRASDGLVTQAGARDAGVSELEQYHPACKWRLDGAVWQYFWVRREVRQGSGTTVLRFGPERSGFWHLEAAMACAGRRKCSRTHHHAGAGAR